MIEATPQKLILAAKKLGPMIKNLHYEYRKTLAEVFGPFTPDIRRTRIRSISTGHLPDAYGQHR